MANHIHTFQTLDDGTRLCFECDEKRPPLGGSREGAGRPKQIDRAKRVTVNLSASDLDWLLAWAMDQQLSGVSAAIRELVKEKRGKE